MYIEERGVFAQFREELRNHSLVLEEFVAACRAVNTRYDTAIYENRFIVGGVVEQLVGAAMRASGARIENVAKTRRGIDLILPNSGVGFSVKSQFKRGPEIRLVNTMGSSGARARWDHATIFVIVGLGIGYADPEIASDGLVARSDALALRIASLKELWMHHPEYLIECEIPSKPMAVGTSRVASDVVAQDVLIEFKTLLGNYQPER